MKFKRDTNTRYNHPRKSEKENDLLYEIRMGDMGDPWGLAMGWLFGVCSWLYENGDYEADQFLSSVKYSPGMGGPETDSDEYQTLEELGDHDSILAVGKTLSRWTDKLRLAGKDY